MSTFWKPQLSSGLTRHVGGPRKELGHMVYALWCRCDLCFMSGPSTLFHMWERGTESGQLCDTCDALAVHDGDLVADGWQRIG